MFLVSNINILIVLCQKFCVNKAGMSSQNLPGISSNMKLLSIQIILCFSSPCLKASLTGGAVKGVDFSVDDHMLAQVATSFKRLLTLDATEPKKYMIKHMI